MQSSTSRNARRKANKFYSKVRGVGPAPGVRHVNEKRPEVKSVQTVPPSGMSAEERQRKEKQIAALQAEIEAANKWAAEVTTPLLIEKPATADAASVDKDAGDDESVGGTTSSNKKATDRFTNKVPNIYNNVLRTYGMNKRRDWSAYYAVVDCDMHCTKDPRAISKMERVCSADVQLRSVEVAITVAELASRHINSVQIFGCREHVIYGQALRELACRPEPQDIAARVVIEDDGSKVAQTITKCKRNRPNYLRYFEDGRVSTVEKLGPVIILDHCADGLSVAEWQRIRDRKPIFVVIIGQEWQDGAHRGEMGTTTFERRNNLTYVTYGNGDRYLSDFDWFGRSKLKNCAYLYGREMQGINQTVCLWQPHPDDTFKEPSMPRQFEPVGPTRQPQNFQQATQQSQGGSSSGKTTTGPASPTAKTSNAPKTEVVEAGYVADDSEKPDTLDELFCKGADAVVPPQPKKKQKKRKIARTIISVAKARANAESEAMRPYVKPAQAILPKTKREKATFEERFEGEEETALATNLSNVLLTVDLKDDAAVAQSATAVNRRLQSDGRLLSAPELAVLTNKVKEETQRAKDILQGKVDYYAYINAFVCSHASELFLLSALLFFIGLQSLIVYAIVAIHSDKKIKTLWKEYFGKMPPTILMFLFLGVGRYPGNWTEYYNPGSEFVARWLDALAREDWESMRVAISYLRQYMADYPWIFLCDGAPDACFVAYISLMKTFTWEALNVFYTTPLTLAFISFETVVSFVPYGPIVNCCMDTFVWRAFSPSSALVHLAAASLTRQLRFGFPVAIILHFVHNVCVLANMEIAFVTLFSMIVVMSLAEQEASGHISRIVAYLLYWCPTVPLQAAWANIPLASVFIWLYLIANSRGVLVNPLYDQMRPNPRRGREIAPVCQGYQKAKIRPGAEVVAPVGKCSCESRGFVNVGPRLRQVTVYSHKACTCNKWNAMVKRMAGIPKRYAARPEMVNDDRDEVSTYYRQLDQHMRPYMRCGSHGAPRNVSVPQLLTNEQWAASRYTKKQQAKMHRSWLIGNPSKVYTAFVKAEKLTLTSEQAELERQDDWLMSINGSLSTSANMGDARGISVPGEAIRYDLGPEANYFNRLMMRRFNGQVMYVCGSNSQDLSEWIDWVRENHEWGLAGMGDDLLHVFKNHEGIWYVESLDASRFDMHVRRAHITATTSFMHREGLRHLAGWIRELSWTRRYIIPADQHDGFMKLKGTRASGDPDTLQSNTFLLLQIAWFAKLHNQPMVEVFHKAGFVMVGEIHSFASGRWDFLQKLYYPAVTAWGGTTHPGPKVGRIAARCFWTNSVVRREHWPGYCKAVANSIKGDVMHVPILRVLIGRILQLAGDVVEVTDAELRKWRNYAVHGGRASTLHPAVYELFEARYGVSKFECDLVEARLSNLQWDQFIDDDQTAYIWKKIIQQDL